MGTSFTNLQVFVGDRSSIEVQAEIIEAIRRFVTSSGIFEEILDSEQAEEADRKIIIASPTEVARWISVYDQGTENQDAKLLADEARAVSAHLKTSVVSIQEYDSDVTYLKLWNSGKLVDQYNSDPDYGSQRRISTKKRAKLAGKPQLWSDLFVDKSNIPATVEKLAQLWKDNRLFAGGGVLNLAPLLGLTDEQIYAGFEYVSAEELEPDFKVLAFRATYVPDFMKKATGLPIFSQDARSIETQLNAGIIHEGAFGHATVINQGGAAKGLRLVIRGSALDQNLFEIKTVRLRPGSIIYQSPPVQRTEAGSSLEIVLPDFEIPAGTLAREISAEPGFTYQRAYSAWLDTQVGISLFGGGLKSGQGELHISFEPLANPDGQTSRTIQVQVHPKPRRVPLRHSGDRNFYILHQLRNLEPSNKLSALVELGVDGDLGINLAGAAFESWVALLNPPKTGNLYIELNEDNQKRTKKFSLEVSRIPKSKKWKDLRTSLANCVSLQSYIASEDGFLFDATSYYGIFGVQHPVLHLWFWKDLTGLTNEEIASITAQLANLIDNLTKQGKGLQAFIARWDWYPQYYRTITPYEEVCGGRPFVADDGKWCRRFLRGVTEELWLGPELFENLGGEKIIGSIQAVTEVNPFGEGLEQGVHLSLKEGASLDDLEQVLAPILADKYDVQFALKRIVEWKPSQSNQESPQE